MENKKPEYVIIKDTIVKLSSVRYFKFNYKKLTIKVCLLNYRKLKFKFESNHDYDNAREIIMYRTIPEMMHHPEIWRI